MAFQALTLALPSAGIPPSLSRRPAVYIRATKTHTKHGEPAHSDRLSRSVRIGDKVRQESLLNLGVDYPVPKEQWRDVVLVTEVLLAGQRPMLAVPPDIEAAAEDLVRRLRTQGLAPPRAETPGRDGAVATVDLDSLEHEDSRSAGGERVCLAGLAELGFRDLLHAQGVRGRDARIATALVVAKMLHPSSEREALRWLREDSAALELLDLDRGKALSLQKLYRTGDVLWRLRRELQAGLFRRERKLLELPDTIVFYDLTNTWYTGRSDKELLRFGRSKEGRKHPLVTLALALEGAGFPRGCEVLAGDVSEPATLAAALGRFEAEVDAGGGHGGKKPTVILDAGIATEENIAWLRERGYGWICVSRETRPAPPEGEADVTLTTSAQQEVLAWRLEEDEGEVRLVAVSEGKRATEEAMLGRHREQYETALRHLHEGLTIPHRRKQYEKVMDTVGRLRERYRQVSAQYEVEVEKGAGPNATAVVWSRTKRYGARDAGAGSYLLRSSQTGWGTEQIVRTYWRLTEIEATFRSLKTELGLRPIWHVKHRRIAAHLFLAVLAYHAVHLIRTRLKARAIPLSWDSIRTRLRPWVRMTTTIRETNGRLIVNRQDVRPPAQVAQIARAVGVEPHHYRRRTRRRPDPNTQT